MLNRYLNLSSRSEYNTSLRLFRMIGSALQNIKEGRNLSDFFNESDVNVSDEQKLTVCKVLLLEKFEYNHLSLNLKNNIESPDKLYEQLSQWTNIDVVILFFHDDLGLVMLGNSSDLEWDAIESLKYGDYISCFYKVKDDSTEIDSDDLKQELRKVFSLSFSKVNPKYILKEEAKDEPKEIFQSVEAEKDLQTKPEKQKVEVIKEVEAPTGKNIKSTPKYSCQVTNELFHNGNVEAWKNIIESYHVSHPTCKVSVFHNGEHINNINTLFKWGKVKSGDVILFSVLGESFKNISKLQRYLYEGASNRFNKYLKADLNKTLDLF